jgi:hypothetical protein
LGAGLEGGERSAAIIGAVCAIATVYYTMGVYYGWDKQEAAKISSAAATGGTHMNIQWPIIILGVLATLSILTSWAMITIRLRRPKESIQKFVPHSGMISLNEIEFNIGRLSQAAPWLELYLTFFNATGRVIRPLSVRGRILVSAQEFHGHIELVAPVTTMYGENKFFRMGVKIPVSSTEAEYCFDSIRRNNLQVGFVDGALAFQVSVLEGSSPEFHVWLPGYVSFNIATLRTDPYLPWQSSR